MKVARLEINNFRHLENLTFDFTYQSGPRKGEPLDKICFIGQSATGKTSLLELIKDYFNLRTNLEVDSKVTFGFNKNKKITFFKDGYDAYGSSDNEIIPFLKDSKLFYFSSDQLSEENFYYLSNTESFSKKPNVTRINVDGTETKYRSSDFDKILRQKMYEFNSITFDVLWEYILDEISNYHNKLKQKGSDLINKGLHQDFSRLGREMEKWKKDNPNPLIDVAIKCLNPILKKLNLEVDLADTSSFIPLKPINDDKAIPANALSTGTKQLMLNSLPIYKLNTENSIIIIDEPERSLYPDIQMELIPFYQSLAPNAQFIVATHSPFIAASFEPEERFILYFDEKGKVQVRNGVSPIGDDPNDILKNDFGLDNLMNESGIEAYKKYLNLKQKMASEKDEKKKKELLKEVVSLGDKYMF